MTAHRPFHERVAERVIEQLRAGTAPWVKPWEGVSRLPFNPVTEKRYRGANSLWLAAAGFEDPRWMTYKQASGQGWQVRKGERGQIVQYWRFHDTRDKRDDKGQIVRDPKTGKAQKIRVALERPRVFHAVVFNAQQIEGVAPLERREYAWDPNARAEGLLKASGAEIQHSAGDRAAYSPVSDKITLPQQRQFPSAKNYYATAIHELGHWTGHASRLDRDLAHPFGSEGYAKEELRAEIASMMLGDALGIGHDPGQHVAYIGSWIKALEEDPREIMRASRDAENIMDYVLTLERERVSAPLADNSEASIGNARREVTVPAPKKRSIPTQPTTLATERVYLAIPYKEKDEAKRTAGKLEDGKYAIRWDRDKESWYARPGADLAKLTRWLPDNVAQRQRRDPREAFAQALLDAGLQIAGLPAMDGRFHRVAVADGPHGNKDGAYRGYLDGRPAGYIKNHRSGFETTWKAAGAALSAKERAKLQAEAAEKLKAREQAELARHRHHARRSEALYRLLPAATADNGYLKAKGLAVIPGAKTDKKGRLVLPLHDVHGKIWSLQRISENGFKSLKKFAKKQGHFLILGGALKEADAIMISEGYATGASLHMVTQRPVVVAFDAGNLATVANALHHAHPRKALFIMGDDDRHREAMGKANQGREAAEAAANAVKGQALFPRFLAGQDGKAFKDWNDLHRSAGLETVRRQIEDGMAQSREEPSVAIKPPAREEPATDAASMTSQQRRARAVGDSR